VSASRQAVRYVRSRGGSLFMWRTPDGRLGHGTERPDGIDFRPLPCTGFELYVDARLNLGPWLVIQRDVFPPWRLDFGWRTREGSGTY
jgi:hypothetical protein